LVSANFSRVLAIHVKDQTWASDWGNLGLEGCL